MHPRKLNNDILSPESTQVNPWGEVEKRMSYSKWTANETLKITSSEMYYCYKVCTNLFEASSSLICLWRWLRFVISFTAIVVWTDWRHIEHILFGESSQREYQNYQPPPIIFEGLLLDFLKIINLIVIASLVLFTLQPILNVSNFPWRNKHKTTCP